MSLKEKQELLHRIDVALNDIRPHLAVDGGDIEVVDVTEEMSVKIKWLGSCETCNMSAMTMRAGVEQTLKGKIPEIVKVEAVNGVI